MTKRKTILIIAIVLLIGSITTVIYLYKTGVIFPKTEQSNQQSIDAKEITYKGKDGITALVLLEQVAKIGMSGTGDMTYVTSINNVSADSGKNEYWAFNVNGKAAEVGAGSYITKNNDTITWRLSSY